LGHFIKRIILLENYGDFAYDALRPLDT